MVQNTLALFLWATVYILQVVVVVVDVVVAVVFIAYFGEKCCCINMMHLCQMSCTYRLFLFFRGFSK